MILVIDNLILIYFLNHTFYDLENYRKIYRDQVGSEGL